jgi:hypothetical protein
VAAVDDDARGQPLGGQQARGLGQLRGAVVGPERADCMASSATESCPDVGFLKPTGKDSPLTTSRWVCDWVVRAPMPPQLIRSA